MYIDIEKLRSDLKSKIDELIDSYISDDSTILDVPQDKIYMEFSLNNQNYIAFTEDSKEIEEIEMMFAKIEFIDGHKILRNIETAQEYEEVIYEFNRRMRLISD